MKSINCIIMIIFLLTTISLTSCFKKHEVVVKESKVKYFKDRKIFGKIVTPDPTNSEEMERFGGQVIDCEFINEINSEEDRRILIKNSDDFYKVTYVATHPKAYKPSFNVEKIQKFEYYVGNKVECTANYYWIDERNQEPILKKIDYFDNNLRVFATWKIEYDEKKNIVRMEPYSKYVERDFDLDSAGSPIL